VSWYELTNETRGDTIAARAVNTQQVDPLAGGEGARWPPPKNSTPSLDPLGRSFIPLPVTYTLMLIPE